MKKFISMVMAAAMVVSLVPATAFAAGDVKATAKIVDSLEISKDDAKENPRIDETTRSGDVPELQMKITDADYKKTGNKPEAEVTLTLDNAEFRAVTTADNDKEAKDNLVKLVSFIYDSHRGSEGNLPEIEVSVKDYDDDEVTFVFAGRFEKDDKVIVALKSELTKTSKGTKATVSVDSDDLNLNVDDLVYAAVVEQGFTVSIKGTADVAEEEQTVLDKDLKIKSSVDDFVKGQRFDLKLNSGFEFVEKGCKGGDTYKVVEVDDNVLTIEVTKVTDEIVIKADNLKIEATSAKAGATATLTVKAVRGKFAEDTVVDNKEYKKGDYIPGTFADTSAKVEVVKVVDYTVVMSVDEDEDLPVIYSGVNVDNKGITDDSDHESLEVTLEESFPGAWAMNKNFYLELPEGVYVTAVAADDENATLDDDITLEGKDGVFWNAYQEGDHVKFEFKKRVMNETNPDNDDCHKITFTLTLVADPTFAGDVVLKLTGDAMDEQEVTIAKFVPIATVKAEQNDLKIDYRYTAIPTNIVITEAEAGLWAKGSELWFAIDKGDYIQFEDDATFTVDEKSGLEIDDFTGKDKVNADGDEVTSIGFEIDEESDEPATVTISDMELFMQRNIPAGPYDLTANGTAFVAYREQTLFAPDCDNEKCNGKCDKKDNDCIVDDVCDYSDVVKEAFVNIITAGREVDDASFTTKVVVPVGESYIISGEKQITLDVPAYISAAGYTMLPVRAVAVALGINTNNVLWDQATKTVTILYGQRIITMVAGQKVVYVNGSAIPASSSVEIVNGRTFLPMRDLATALGVTDITWDAATKTATLNGNQK